MPDTDALLSGGDKKKEAATAQKKWPASVILAAPFMLLIVPLYAAARRRVNWKAALAMIVRFSDWLYRRTLGEKRILRGDKRIFVFDMVSAALIALPMETAGAKLGVWTYRQDLLQWHWGLIPFFDMPYELLFGYCLLMLIVPTFIRYWEKPFEETSL